MTISMVEECYKGQSLATLNSLNYLIFLSIYTIFFTLNDDGEKEPMEMHEVTPKSFVGANPLLNRMLKIKIKNKKKRKEFGNVSE